MIEIEPEYDVIVVGAGPSGCACANQCGQLGLKTLCIDNQEPKRGKNILPGIITHPGCLETIILLESASHYFSIIKNSSEHGINVESLTLDLKQMMRRKTNILTKIGQDIINKFEKNNVAFINAKAKLLAPNKIEITSSAKPENKTITSAHIVLASESIPITVPCAPVNNKNILDSNAALSLTELPKKLAILGAGVLGLELASIWDRLGAETILLDAQELFLGLVDHQIAREAYKIFSNQGLDIRVGTRVLSSKIANNQVHIEYQDIEGIHTIQVDKLFVASGRKPNSENLAAPEANLFLDENGYIHTDENYRTNLPNVYAIGDLTLMAPMLAHKGIAEGEFVANFLANAPTLPINYKIIPNIIYTDPEIAWVGQTEQSLNAIGYTANTGITYLNKNVRAISGDASNGMAKVITCAESDVILGIQIISKNASELITAAAIAMEFSANFEDIERTMHPHPCFAEIIREASKLTGR